MNDREIVSYNQLKSYIEKEGFIGYDPYDTLLSKIPFKELGKWFPVLAIQFQKRNPINIRPLLGIKKGINPKAYGLFLKAYSMRYALQQNQDDLEKMKYFFTWLKNNHSKSYKGYGWGYNFPWASSEKYLAPYIPSAVVTGFVCKGIFQYYLTTNDPDAVEAIHNAKDFIISELPQYRDDSGLCISYTPVKRDICYNASLLAGEVLAMEYYFTQDESLKNLVFDMVDFVVKRQKSNGSWAYSEDIRSGKERLQLDFHQGYIIESIFEIMKYLKIKKDEWDNAIKKGLEYYKNVLFMDNGQSYWRYPKKYPIDIHNQSQGIITFNKIYKYDKNYFEFSKKILRYTIRNMQSVHGYFYYQKFIFHTHKISYMRWSQAWMFLAMTQMKES